jgi:hypothetical protein
MSLRLAASALGKSCTRPLPRSAVVLRLQQQQQLHRAATSVASPVLQLPHSRSCLLPNCGFFSSGRQLAAVTEQGEEAENRLQEVFMSFGSFLISYLWIRIRIRIKAVIGRLDASKLRILFWTRIRIFTFDQRFKETTDKRFNIL